MLGIGIDAVDIDRFRRVLERTPSIRERIFTASEVGSVSSKSDQAPSLAARFAAREAAMKVLGVGIGAIDLHDVSIARRDSGEPVLLVTGRARDLAAVRGIANWHVSLSHTAQVAVAVVAAS